MTDSRPPIPPFPGRKRPTPRPGSQSLDAQSEAEQRADLLLCLFNELLGKKNERTDSLEIRVAYLFAKDLVEELVALYRQALREAREGHDGA
ncbi:hypothetical protein M2262_002722 [Pseudomonas sp. BIGb0408]|uniref:Uncharacterized protein n=1 Tax=Phytopseudomonas flavescens TaxID=29435 RepID=A0A7Z0BQ37_9GAMM|nr:MULTISPECIES: hypothetical protein [Pseudomonas]MCW2292672.1 hypothetical protein [Pseudomonas sp. BIGb0408]NYH72758.1 hypothetical protein [Pseudomonas flavescens]